MKFQKIIILCVLITFILAFSFNAQAIGGNWNDPYMSMPNCGWCTINGSTTSWYYEGANPVFSDPIPSWHWWAEYVTITAKGVQTCINVTVPAGCNLNVTFQWFNTSHYTGLWVEWRDDQNWDDGWIHVNWTTEPDPDNDTFWLDYSNWSGLVASQKLCAYNTNVSCSTENDWNSDRFFWRATAELVCAGYTTNTTCTYCFTPELCPVSYIYPPSPNGTACPCCEAMCVGVNNDLGHPMNVTIWGREDDYGYYNIWTHYENISNGTYCFCLDSITPSAPAHAIGHSHTQQNVTLVDTWHNITFDHGEAEHINCNPFTGICNIELYGHYDVRYWCVVQDEDANPTGHKMAVRILQNGTDEIDGSYREVTFSKQGYEQHIIGFVHEHFVPGTTLRFQYIGDDTDQSIDTDGTWSTDDINFYAEIMRMDNEEHMPLKYNTTYYWYVNITDTVTGEQSDSAVFQFRTEENLSRCPCGIDALNATLAELGVTEDKIRDDTWILGVAIVFAMIPLGISVRRRRK